ncbi:SGNH/GDSL hydrolase family protein [Streptomyces sp. OR43]|uniref:SGNH/GDSL hydrolase family protein n=1 Tax=Streptomyces sp. or43 TaxID=2478957 RepID=UPI0011CE4C75|nr:SGNH/GDSL hydrolase family protein [Streptomyces sp. or43]TXS36065.1 SGNH/GDSL hydrolase family protein [Streptomyces sp. or43]
MPRRQGSALLIALLVGTAALAALVAFTGSLLFTEPRAKAAVAAAGPQGVARTPAAPARSTGLWLATWAAAPVLGATDPEQGPDPSLRTIRNVVHTSIGGDAARITLSNLFGTHPLLVDRVTVNAVPVTFRNAAYVTIAAGGQIVSDPVVVPVAADADLVVTLRTPTARGPVTVHPNSHQTSFTEGPRGTTESTTDWRYLTAVDVRGRTATGTLVAFGDSLTAGSGSTTDTNSRWPDVLADRLAGRYAVVNQGIGGNRILLSGVGPRGLDRFDRDVLAVTGVKTVVIALGINDIQAFPQERDPARITDALRTLTERAHARGLRVIGATLMPYEGQGNWTPARNAVRAHVNEAIRAGGVFDEVLDFDRAVQDPSRPSRLLPAYDSGDHLHLNDAGYHRLGTLTDIASLLRAEPSSDAL